MRHISWTATVCIVACLFTANSAWSQSEPGLQLNRVTVNDNSAISSDSWVTVMVEVANPTGRDAEVVVSTSLEDRPYDQYGRQFWVPANSTRINWFPMHMAKINPPIKRLSGGTFDPDTDRIGLLDNTLVNGELIRFSNPTGNLPDGLEEQTDYYVMNRDPSGFQVCRTKVGPPVDIMTEGSGPTVIEWQPVRFQKTFRTYLFDRTDGTDIAIKTNTGMMYRENPLTVVNSRVATGLILDLTDLLRIDSPYEAVLAMRAGQELDRVTLQMQTAWMPRIEENLAVFDQLVIAEQEIANYPAGVTAIRRWIQSGGTCWIMLDRVGVDLAKQLIGSEFELELVESVPLTEFKINRTNSNPRVPSQIVAEREFEIPVTMERVFASNVDVVFEIDEWPAAFWVQVGNGRVLVTTLGSKGWLRGRREGDLKAGDEDDMLQNTSFYGIQPLNELGETFLAVAQPKEIDKVLLSKIHQDQIGFRITSRSTVLVVFSTFTLALLTMGLVLAKRGRLDWMVFVTPAVSVLMAAVVLALGLLARADAERKFAETQLISVEAGGEEFAMTGISTVLNESSSSTEVSSRLGGRFISDDSGSTTKNQRWLWSDAEHWRIENSSLPSGMSQVHFHQSSELPQPLTATVTFTANGLSGQVETNLLATMADGVILTRNGYVPVGFDSAGRFELQGDELNEGRQFIASALITDDQRRHREMYESLFAGPQALQSIINPRLAFWSDGLDSGFDFDGVEHSAARGLYLVPVKFAKLGGSQKIHIPDVLLSYDSVQKLNGNAKSSVYDGGKDEWYEKNASISADALLRIQLPADALPLQVESLKMRVDLNAAEMEFSVWAMAGQSEVLQEKISGPDGKYEFTITDPKLLEQDDRGGLLVGLKVQPLRAKGPSSGAWRINDVYFQVLGTTAPEE